MKTVQITQYCLRLLLTYFGCIISGDQSLEKNITFSKTEGQQRRGKPLMRRIDTRTPTTYLNISVIMKMVQENISFRYTQGHHELELTAQQLTTTITGAWALNYVFGIK